MSDQPNSPAIDQDSQVPNTESDESVNLPAVASGVNDLTAAIQNLQESMEAVRNDITDLRTDLKGVRTCLGGLRTDFENLGGTVDGMNTTLSDVQRDGQATRQTVDRISTRLQASDHNFAARNVNSHLDPSQRLRRLHNTITNLVIPNFPNTRGSIDDMTDLTITAVLQELGISVRSSVALSVKQDVLRTAIGKPEVELPRRWILY
ncbi:hypothetical protein FKW77_002622 [Venturia effusa]|uniref:Uncharacterized protein n=1 Tax=Venturia effusa TaxID=50376 RepID=A0A517LMG1_9PEZI|nr:hypothetical protein FKW77_002622 [Venturia effusa]